MSGESQSLLGGGFDLLQIEMYRFMNYHSPVKFSFVAPNIVISGPTGSGKTTVLDALTFSLYGKCSRSDLSMVKTEDICGKNGRVTCNFRIGTNQFKVTRGRNNKGKSYVELFINEERINGRIPEINEKIRSTILGMNYSAFVNSTIIRQDEMKSLGSKSSIERLRTLQNLFRLDIFDKATKDTQEQLSGLISHKNQIQGELRAKDEQLLQITAIETEVKELIPQLEKGKKKHKKLLQEVKEQERKEQSHREQYEKFKILDSKLKSVQNRHQKTLSKIKTSKADSDEFNIIKKKVMALEKQLEAIRDMNEEISILEGFRKEHTLLHEGIKRIKQNHTRETKQLNTEVSKKNTQITNARNRINNLQTDSNQTTAFKILNREGRLTERIQRISLEQTWDLSEKLLNEIKIDQKTAKSDLSKLKDEKARINEDSFKLSEIQDRIKDLEVEAKELKSREINLRKMTDKELKGEERKLHKVGLTEEKKNLLIKLQADRKQNKKVHQKFNDQKSLLESKVDPTSRIQTYQSQIEELLKEISLYQQELIDYEKFREKYRLLQQELKKKREQTEELHIHNTRQDQNIKNHMKNIGELKKLAPEVKELKKRFEKIIEEENILSKLKNEVFHTRGAPFYAINKILPRLGKRASLILAELTNQRYTSIQLEKIDKGFEINIRTRNGERDIATFSGGERTQINAALRLAISEELSSLGDKETTDSDTKKTLFIDEGDLGSLDTLEAQQAFVRKLFDLGTKFKIILITHITEIADQFPHSIQITLDVYGRSIKGDTN